MHIEQIEQIEAVLNAINWKPSIRVYNVASKSGVFTGGMCCGAARNAWGARGPEFKSRRSDQFKMTSQSRSVPPFVPTIGFVAWSVPCSHIVPLTVVNSWSADLAVDLLCELEHNDSGDDDRDVGAADYCGKSCTRIRRPPGPGITLGGLPSARYIPVTKARDVPCQKCRARKASS